MSKPSIVFFGTGPVAAKSLELLLTDFDIQAVVTKPKPAHHRGDFPVLDVAETHNLPIFTVTDKQSLSDLMANKPFQTDVAILIDFGIIVAQDVIDYFPKGIINSHFSLLPEWRGADPITFAILSGQKKTGVSLMLLVEAMDEGPLLAVGEQPLDGTETTPNLTTSLIYLSDALLKEQVPRYLNDESHGIDQSKMPELIKGYPSKPSYSRKLEKNDGILDFKKSAEVLEREIRAFIEWPKSSAHLNTLDVIISKAHVVDLSGTPGSYDITKNTVIVFCGEKALSLEEVKPAGKQTMSIQSFLAGYRDRL